MKINLFGMMKIRNANVSRGVLMKGMGDIIRLEIADAKTDILCELYEISEKLDDFVYEIKDRDDEE